MKSIRPLFDVVRMQHYNEKKLFLCFVCTLLVWCLSTKRRSMAEEGNRRLARGSFFVGAITFPVTVGKCIGKCILKTDTSQFYKWMDLVCF